MAWLVAAAAVTVPVAADPEADPPGAYELLERVRQAYGELSEYQDLGEIRVLTTVAGEERRVSQWFTTAASAGGGFRWDLVRPGDQATERRVLWRDGGAAFLYDSRRGQYRPVASPAAELVHGFGDGGFEALAVAVLVAGSADALAEPEAASVEGPEKCDAGSCWILMMSRMGGTITSELWIDRDSFLIQRVEVELVPAAEVLGEAVAEAGLLDRRRRLPPRAVSGPIRISVFHQIQPGPVAAERLRFQPPADARRVERWPEPAGAMVAVAAEAESDVPAFGFFDEITVSLVTVEARIVDRRGDPLTDLAAGELVARVGKRELPVTAVEWVPASSSVPSVPLLAEKLAAVPRSATESPSGRLVALFVQADYEPTVVQGHVKILPSLRELVEGLPAGDRVAVFAYYRRLEMMQDLTRDREATVAVLDRAFRPGAVPVPRRVDGGGRRLSLREHFDVREARRATSPERALELVAEALAALPGDKLVIYVGWSIGHFRPSEGVVADQHYLPALQALDAIRAPVFVLDIMEAAWHALEHGLQGIAGDTGGIYLKTAYFPSSATRRLARTISGYFRLTIDRGQPPLARGKLRIALRERRGLVLFKPVILQ
ncbi:MAG: hypothetical protein V3T72_19070 [Thermoanaerobaculia bacterium]